MKTLIILLILLTAGMAWATTWEGELDPNEFRKWKFLSVTPNVEGLAWVFIKNPDQASPIDTVALAVDLNSNILGYRYFKDGEPYSYIFDNNNDKYEVITPELIKNSIKAQGAYNVWKKNRDL